MQRVTSRELLDDDLGDPRDLQASLDDLWRINRYFGGVAGTMRLLNGVLARKNLSEIRILDVGAGDGRLAAFLAQALRQRGLQAEIFVLDRRVSHLTYGQTLAGALQRVVADALLPSFRKGSFEIVLCNLLLHHFSGTRARQLLNALEELATVAVLINDLERRWLPYLFIRYAPWIARSPITRLDGAASVRQAYTRAEIKVLLAEAGIQNFDVVQLPFFRLGILIWKASSPESGCEHHEE